MFLVAERFGLDPWTVLTSWTCRQVNAAVAWMALRNEQAGLAPAAKKKPAKRPPPKTKEEAIERANKTWGFLFDHPAATVVDQQGNVIRAPTARAKAKPKG